jgi:HD-GYP domain-containing protein (c-di-GMP phosphodiesterase class II)
MENSYIVLSGACALLQGLKWKTADELRIGRQTSMDIVLQDHSVNGEQALIRKSNQVWVIRDLAGSDRYPTLLNGNRVHDEEVHLQLNDALQFGRLKLQVAELGLNGVATDPRALVPPRNLTAINSRLKTSGTFVKVQAAAHRTWDQALEAIACDADYRQGRQNQHLLTLLRTGYHLCHVASLDELLRSILKESVPALEAQRGAIVMADAQGELHLRDVYAPHLPMNRRDLGFSRTLALRCFSQGESLLCQDAESEAALLSAQSVRRGAMSSIICAVLRSPRQKLGILHLDRGPFQEPFSDHDFFLADAVAASVSVGIESALLVERQREEFIQSVTSLARAVEMRDQYTGDHTNRVTAYSLLLAHELKLTPAEIYHVQIGTPLHDIGKIGVDDAILRKPGQLTSDEFEAMKLHTVKGAMILQSMTNLVPMIPIVRHHHERWDGNGYPDGLSRDNIPRIARVVAIADAFDAMTSNRPYRKAMSASQAFDVLYAGAGKQFDPVGVESFLALRPRLAELMRG